MKSQHMGRSLMAGKSLWCEGRYVTIVCLIRHNLVHFETMNKQGTKERLHLELKLGARALAA